MSHRKIFGLQHPDDKVVEIFNRFGFRGKLLDTPAGLGIISQKLKEAGFDVVAADINPQLFCIQGVTCEKADLNKDLPLKDETFKFVLCSKGIKHLEDPFHFVRECYRILKPKGKILITTPSLFNLKSRVANLLVGFNLFTGRPQNEVDEYWGGERIFSYLACLQNGEKSEPGRNREIFRHVMSADLIFGKKLLVLAEKEPNYQKGI